MNPSITITFSLALFISLWNSAVRAEGPLQLLPEYQRLDVLEAGIKVLSHRLEQSRRELQAMQAVRRENNQLKNRIDEMAEDMEMIERHRRETIEATLLEKEQVHKALHNVEGRWAAAMREAKQLRSEVDAAKQRIAEAERLLTESSKSRSPEVLAWLRKVHGPQAWPTETPFNTPREMAEKTASQALREVSEADFVDTPLLEALEYWSEFHGVDVVLEEELAISFEKSGKDTLLNGRIVDIDFAGALKHFLEPLGLSYRCDNAVIRIVPRP